MCLMADNNVPGRDMLREWLKDRGIPHQVLATNIGVKRAMVSQWCSRGGNRPNEMNRHILEYLCGISTLEWLNPRERERYEKVRKHLRSLRKSAPVAELSDREKMAGRI